MASIFTFETGGSPRVESPWLTPTNSPKPSTPQLGERRTVSGDFPNPEQLSDYGVTRLEAEPQEGPTEYKLHLLLRPRRNYSSSSTGSSASGSQQYRQPSSNQTSRSDQAAVLAPSNQSRQNRLVQMTTQLKWRLEQSSPYHTSSTNDLVLPKLPEFASSLETPSRPGKLLAGLEESRGALYEIGVSDDGTFVGLTKDEMDESLTNLKAMAFSIGCNVKVVRIVAVGECEWQEPTNTPRTNEESPKSVFSTTMDKSPKSLHHRAQLWVAEALVTPDLSSRESQAPAISPMVTGIDQAPRSGNQLRVTLTGPTTSGKSSLLGTLSTATLDNGRGGSRLSLLRHRHEIASGVTSSVAQELVGYKESEVINYASGNVSSWTDVHAAAEQGRLVFVSDSAGHPRYRRTTVRGLVGWNPHWILLCIAADDGENVPPSAGGTSSAQEVLGAAGAGVDLAKAHLELCLKLDKPLAIVITKLDLASISLRQTLSKLLTAIKAGGRSPEIVKPDLSKNVLDSELNTIRMSDQDAVEAIVDKMIFSDGLTSIVPIIMTSSAKGTGIRSMHALLQALPIPPTPTSHDYIGPVLNPEQPMCLFHIEDVFGVPASREPLASKATGLADKGVVIAGHLRFGRLSVGCHVVVGPFPAEPEIDDFGASFSNPSTAELARVTSQNMASAAITKGEWHNAHLVSIRNLRLPVHTLEAGQVGTLGMVFDIPQEELSNGPFERRQPLNPRMRKGMVVAIPSSHMIATVHTLQAASGFTASFEDGDINSITAGSLVVVYIASIRATAKVLKITPHEDHDIAEGPLEDTGVFGLEDHKEDEPEPLLFGSDGVTDLAFELITNREWIELGSQVLVMPGGGHGLYYGLERGEKGVAGLEGFVGKVTEVVD